ncbi:hypothetical protein ACFPRL_30430 [Pseudoclavibacter helvolus]
MIWSSACSPAAVISVSLSYWMSTEVLMMNPEGNFAATDFSTMRNFGLSSSCKRTRAACSSSSDQLSKSRSARSISSTTRAGAVFAAGRRVVVLRGAVMGLPFMGDGWSMGWVVRRPRRPMNSSAGGSYAPRV